MQRFRDQSRIPIKSYELGPFDYRPYEYHIIRKCSETNNILPQISEFQSSTSIQTPYDKKYLNDEITTDNSKAITCGTIRPNAHITLSNIIDTVTSISHPLNQVDTRSQICLTENIPGNSWVHVNTCGDRLTNPGMMHFLK